MKKHLNLDKIFEVKTQIILIIFSLILIVSTLVIKSSFAENAHFIKTPTIKGSIIQTGKTIKLSITTSFIVSGVENKSTMIYLTTSNITSNNTMCNNKAVKQTLVLGPDQSQKISIESVNGNINFNDKLPYMIKNISQTSCPTIHVKSVSLQDARLHLTQDNGVEILNFNFGNVNLQASFFDSTPKIKQIHIYA